MATGVSIWLPLQFWWTFTHTLANFLHEKESPTTGRWILEIRRWEFSIHLHWCRTEGRIIMSSQNNRQFWTSQQKTSSHWIVLVTDGQFIIFSFLRNWNACLHEVNKKCSDGAAKTALSYWLHLFYKHPHGSKSINLCSVV